MHTEILWEPVYRKGSILGPLLFNMHDGRQCKNCFCVYRTPIQAVFLTICFLPSLRTIICISSLPFFKFAYFAYDVRLGVFTSSFILRTEEFLISLRITLWGSGFFLSYCNCFVSLISDAFCIVWEFFFSGESSWIIALGTRSLSPQTIFFCVWLNSGFDAQSSSFLFVEYFNFFYI